jgi:hypothetical protein
MKSRFVLHSVLATLAVVVGLGVSNASAQDAKSEKLVDLKAPMIQAQSTPDIKADFVKEKRWKPKEWLELEVPFIASAPKGAKSNFTSYDLLTFKYFLFLANADKDKSRILTAEVNHVNVPVGEAMASVVYLSPSAVLSLTGSNRVVASSVTLWAVEVSHEGKTVGFISSKGKSPSDAGAEWWKATGAPPTVAGMLKNKMETPFAPLWGDFHAEVQSNK